ncbi:MAG: DnaB-like helicase N-terminal domain-containing protein, partial [Minicystis sp.]
MSGPPRKGGRYPPQRMEPASIAGRVPPHDLDAEAAVLSAILLNREALDRVLELLKPEHFYSDANGKIFEAAMALAVAGTPIDIVSVASYLRDREQIAQIGGASYLAQLSDATPAVAHVGAHAAVVYEKWRVRQLIATCQRVAAEGYGDVGVVQEFIDSCEQDIY